MARCAKPGTFKPEGLGPTLFTLDHLCKKLSKAGFGPASRALRCKVMTCVGLDLHDGSRSDTEYRARAVAFVAEAGRPEPSRAETSWSWKRGAHEFGMFWGEPDTPDFITYQRAWVGLDWFEKEIGFECLRGVPHEALPEALRAVVGSSRGTP